jgi:hypothetical protein
MNGGICLVTGADAPLRERQRTSQLRDFVPAALAAIECAVLLNGSARECEPGAAGDA